MDIDVRIYLVQEAQEGVSQNGNSWKRQGFVAETLDHYPKKIVFNVNGADRIERLGVAKLKTGDHKKVFFQIDAREYQGKWYNEVTAYDIRETEEAVKSDPSAVI